MVYISVEEFRIRDADRNSRRIRDMPYGKVALKGSLMPLDVNFGLVEVMTMSSGQSIMLLNQGYDKLTINSMTTVGDFLINSPLPAAIDPGETAAVSVLFNPRREGVCTGGLSLDLGQAQGKHFVTLRGTGTAVPIDPSEQAQVVLDVKINTLTEIGRRDYPLSSLVPAGYPDRMMVFVGGAIQKPGSDYTIISNGEDNILRFAVALDVAGLEILGIGTKVIG